MPLTKSQKVEVLKTLRERVLAAPSVVFVRFSHLSVAALTELRKALRGEQVGFQVVKKTLWRLAAADKKIDGELPPLEGALAVAYGAEDPLAPARAIAQFVKKTPEALQIEGGVYEGKYLDAGAMTTLSLIPPKPVLLGQFVGLLTFPLRRLVATLDQVAKNKTS
jgi:large subunit ribosomal protein L10